ncbi:choice-of-anchor A family protein, partial [Kitasatospora sp. NPDC004289]
MKTGTINLDRISAPLRTALAATACTGILLTVPAPAAQAAPGNGRSASCPARGEFPPIGHDPKFTDANVALFAGGGYTVDGGAAEAEGLLVVAGNATFAKSPGGGVFNVGRVGAGSGILPAGGQVMLAVGGDLRIAKGTTLDVGSGLTTGPGYGGAVRAGGTIDEQGRLDTNGGDRRSGIGAAAALDPYAGFGTTVQTQSAALGALRPTGTAQRSGATVTFRSTGPSNGTLQVFELASADLDGASTFLFESIPVDASVLVNVTGTHAVSVSPMSVGYNGERVDVYGSAHFGEAAAKVLYNLRETPKLTLGGGGNFIGSLLAPKASADLTASTNGRLYVGGDVHTHGSGNESHNYPWTGTPVFSCSPTPVPQPSTPPVPTPSPSVPATTPPGTPTAPSTPNSPSAPGTPGVHTPSTPPSSGRPSAPGTPAPSPSGTPDTPPPGKSLAFTGSTGTFAIAGAGLAAVAAGGAVVVA